SDPEAIEIGARLEFRLGRFSFQLSDFWGYEDLPYIHKIQTFERNVDPLTGRPRRFGAGGPCITGAEPACLPIVSNINPDGSSAGEIVDPANRTNLLSNYASNMQQFTMICATSIGFNAVDPTACGQSVFNSRRVLPALELIATRDQAKTLPTVATVLANALAGNRTASLTVTAGFTGVPMPFVPLSEDPCDRFFSDGMGGCTGVARTPHPFALGADTFSLNTVLTDEQEALLGCGPFWGTDCEADGIDLLNAEASVLLQSLIGIEGRYARGYADNGLRGWH